MQRLGAQLVDNIPQELRQPAFRYSFQVVNLKEINAFALPGGPMFLNRGMLDAAKTDGEVIGVMAHEISHVVLRHGTAQATKGQKFQAGAIAGQILGAIVGGTAGSVISQGTQFGLGATFLKYSREYEREADLLGAQIMARAGYDPRQMANMFKTIQKQGGSQGPEWLSDHPDPGNRYEAINREAEALGVKRVGARPPDASRACTRGSPSSSRRSPASRPRAQAQQRQRTGQTDRGGAVGRTAPTSSRRTVSGGRISRATSCASACLRTGSRSAAATPLPTLPTADTGRPQTATRRSRTASRSASRRVRAAACSKAPSSCFRASPGPTRTCAARGATAATSIGGRQGLTTTLSNVSEVTGQSETINLSTVGLDDGTMLFMIGVAPQNEARTYMETFNRVRQSLQFSGGGSR